MGRGKVIYYTTLSGINPVRNFINLLLPNQRSKIFRIFSLIEEYGIYSITTHVKKLTGTPFWEIRILGKDNIRVLYVLVGKFNALILHGFIKKLQKTPRKEVEIAMNRYKDWSARNALDK